MKIAPAGDRALLVDIGDVAAAELHGLAAACRGLPRVMACVPGQRSLLVVFKDKPDPDALAGVTSRPAATAASRRHRIRVSFRDEYGPDLVELGVPRHEFLKRVDGLRLVVRYIGFRGGFGYLDGWPAEWARPRRPTSRPRVPAGTFAVAGTVAGFYPVTSPGGWNLLGRTSTPLEYALTAGDEIEIEATLDPLDDTARSQNPPPPEMVWESGLRLTSSPLTTVVAGEDWSRAVQGKPPGGAFDPAAAAHANLAVGRKPEEAIFESALTGPRATALRDLYGSWFGADAEIGVDGTVVRDPRQFQIRAGAEIVVGRISAGMRGYLAVGAARGAVGPLARGDRLTIHAVAGPHESDVRELVCDVTPQLDRVGIRMRPVTSVDAGVPADLPSCGLLCGTIQLHPDGTVVAMGPDHPVTGGYLQPMTVPSSERWKLAQLAPGERVRIVCE